MTMRSLIIKKFIIYSVAGIVLQVAYYIIYPHTIWSDILGFLYLFAVIIDIGRTIKNSARRKKYIIYLAVLAGQMIFFQLVSRILGVGLENTWLAFVGVNVMVLTIIAILFDIKNSLEETNARKNDGTYFFVLYSIYIISIGILILNVFVLLRGLP